MITANDTLDISDKVSVELIPTEIGEYLSSEKNRSESSDAFLMTTHIHSECRHQFLESEKLVLFDWCDCYEFNKPHKLAG